MIHEPLTTEILRRTIESLGRHARAEVRTASRIVGESLMAEDGRPGIIPEAEVIDTSLQEHEAKEDICTIDQLAPVAILRRGPAQDRERALISALLALYFADLVDDAAASKSIPFQLPNFDWLEFDGTYVPYSAIRVLLPPTRRNRVEEVIRSHPPRGGSDLAQAAVRAMRGIGNDKPATTELAAPDTIETPPRPSVLLNDGARSLSVATEVESATRHWLVRGIAIMSGWALVRGMVLAVARLVFSLKRPASLTLDGRVFRLVGHTEIFGRTVRTFDFRLPLDQMSEIKREARYPMLPVALGILAIGIGTTFGARTAIEGAGLPYFPLVALGVFIVFGGWLFDVVLRALVPGTVGRTRLSLRTRDGTVVALGRLDVNELEKVLETVDAIYGNHPTRAGSTVARRG